MHRNRGFTLVELLVYTAIFAIVAGLLTTIFYVVINTQKKTSVSGEVSQQLNLVLTTVQRLVGDSSLVEAVYEGNNPSSTCATFCTLKLRREDPAKDPTIISSDVNGVYLQEGSSTRATLTTNKVLVNNLKFTKQEIPGGHAVVEISTSFSYNTTNPTFAVTKAIESAIARVDAATFDADLIPNQDNTFDIGQVSGSNLRWRSGRFSQDLTVGGNVGIGNTSPSYKLDVTGTLRATATSTFSGNVGIGTTGPQSTLSIGSANFRLDKGDVSPNAGYIRFGDNSGWKFYIGRSQESPGGAYDAGTTGVLMTVQDNGNVGIGTESPGQKLSVAGIIESTSGGFKFPDATVQTTAASPAGSSTGSIPAGAVMSFNLAACPTGWTEFTSARGRYIVGLPLGGNLGSTAGTALSNLENRAVGQHNHGITGSPSISDPGHSHTITPGGSSATPADPSFAWGYSINSRATSVATTGITIGVGSLGTSNAGTVAGTNAPYIQLLTCQKS